MLRADAACATVERSAEVTVNEWEVPAGSELEPEVTYYWRVRSNDNCGIGEWTAAFSFTTGL